MRALAWTAFAALVACLAFAGAAAALDVTPDKFEAKLKSYDPATVQAAREYMATFGMKQQLEKSAPQMRATLTAQLKAKNPQIDEKQLNIFFDAFFKSAFVDDAPILERATMLIMLDTLSQDELVAANKFYSSPVGQRILAKLPTMMGRMPEVTETMQTYVLPRALEKARGELQKSGFDVKL